MRGLMLVGVALWTLLAGTLPAADWKPGAGPLMTKWGKEVSPTNVHPEYPRPQLVREKWTNLNGLWDYAVRSHQPDAQARVLPEKYDGQILVPFPIESALSGVMKRIPTDATLIYHRTFKSPDLKDGRRLLLHFGAVDWKCEVTVNGKKVGDHTGGYDPFTFDITDALDKSKAEQQLIVSVTDPADANWQPRGKQVQEPKGIWYTPTTGIWQTVWLEEVPKTYISAVKVIPEVDNDRVRVDVTVVGSDQHEISTIVTIDQGIVAGATFQHNPSSEAFLMRVKIEKPRLWSPDDPFLYGLRVSLKGEANDVVTSYFAMRKSSLGKDEHGVTRMMLNNKPVFQWGPLDQGFWPDGLYTPPTDAAMKYDIEVTKQLGFNMIRKHVKVEPARWYYYCDQMGILVWQDMPSGDKNPPWSPLGIHNGKQIERSKESADNFRAEWKNIIDALHHFPSIVSWVPFNEAWGQFDTVGVTEWTKKYDPSRLVNCASGGNDFPTGDIVDLHRYPGPTIPGLEEKRAAVLGEFGGLGLPLPGHTWQSEKNWGYKSFTTKEDLNDAYAVLIKRLHPLIGKGLSAAVYTQTTDVEVEVNGFLTYDREVLKFDMQKTAALSKLLFTPSPQELVVVPTAIEKALMWKYTTTKPADGWQNADFDDSKWQEGEGGFGEPSTPGSKVRTNWKTPEIWLRRTVELPSGPVDGMSINIHHDEDAEVYINGVQALAMRGYISDYVAQPLDSKGLAALKPGKNVISVHCKQTGGGQYIDVGISRLVEKTK